MLTYRLYFNKPVGFVKQGDVLAPTLFLFPMQAMAGSVIAKWRKNGIKAFTYLYDELGVTGKMVRHRLLRKDAILPPQITVAELILVMYVDDGALYEDMVKGVSIVQEEMRRFGLIMHVGGNNARSKTEFIYIPAITRTKSIINQYIQENGITYNPRKSIVPAEIEEKKWVMSEERKHEILVEMYDRLPETKSFCTTTGREIPSTKTFVYLGLLLHFTLRDTYDINRRLTKSNQIMGALQFYWKRPEVNLWAKCYIYRACVLSLLLWGAETWAMTPTHERRLKVFHHRSIRMILGITMKRVEEERITNEMVHKAFCNIETIHETIRYRKLSYIGHIVQEWKAPSSVLTAWINGKRPRGRPRCTARSTVLAHLHDVLPNVVTKDGEIGTWAPYARDWCQWTKLIKGELKHDEFRHQTPPPPPNEPSTPSPTPPRNPSSSPPQSTSPPQRRRRQ